MSTDIEYSFKVRLSEVAAKFNSAIPEGVLAAGSTPFFRCDFDGKVLTSENCNLPGDPVWQFRQSFEYRLLEPGIDALVASLAGRTANFEVFVSDGSRQALVGTCAVDLLSVATGASKFQLRLTPAYSPTTGGNHNHHSLMSSSNAYLSFNLVMEQQSVVHLSLQQLSFASLPTPTATKLHYLLLEGGTAIETSVLAPTSTPYFETLPPVQCRTSMKALLSTSVRITLIDAMRGDAPIGTLDLPISELLLAADEIGTATGTFKKNLYSSKEYCQNFAALVTGSLLIERLPAFAQLSVGQNVDGEISGKPLLPSCFLPPRYVKRPSRLPDYQHGPRALGVNHNHNSSSHNAAAGSGYALLRNSSSSSSGTYIPPQVSTMPALSSPQRRIYESTDPNFQAHRLNAYDSNALPGSGNLPFKSPHRNSTSKYSNNHHDNNGAGGGGGGRRSHSRNHHKRNVSTVSSTSGLNSSRVEIAKSPVASATRQLIDGQTEANRVLETQQRRLAETREELTQRIAEETAASQNRLDDLAKEEFAVKEKLASLGGHISHLHQQLEALDEGFENTVDAQSSSVSGYSKQEMRNLEREMLDLETIALDLNELANNLRTHVVMDDSLRRNALDLVERSREQLYRDSQALAVVENKIISGATSGRTTSSPESRAVSPTRHHNIPKLAGVGLSRGNSPASASRRIGGGRSSPSQQTRADAVTTSPRRNSSANNNNYNNSSILNNSDIRKAATDLSQHQQQQSLMKSPQGDGAGADSFEGAGDMTTTTTSGRGDPLIQALNSAIVNSDVVGVRKIIGEHPRALHPRALLLACTQRKPDQNVIEALLDYRPQLMQMTDASTGRTALHCACAADVPNAEAVRVLLDHGASLDEYDAEGLSPFHVALLNCGDFGNIMRYALIDYGASVTQPTQGGCTPALLCASSDSHLEALMFLKQAGADLSEPAPDQRRLPSHRAPPPRLISPVEKAERCGAVATRRFLGRQGTMA